MSLNLITDAWIPVRCKDGSRRTIAPWEMADNTVITPDWPRPDLNIACYELLIGLIYLADPPEHIDDWNDRRAPNPEGLREKLAPYAPAFNLLGDGPLFMQDLEAFGGEVKGVDLLFIDSAGENAADENKDLMVHRKRYQSLDLPTAAMALFTLQNFAPAGGPGMRTSVRGGGPLVTLITHEEAAKNTLWSLVWANVPYGKPSQMRELPWMRATRISPKIGGAEGQQTFPPKDCNFSVEAFFGMPRRLRMVVDEGKVVGVIQKQSGTNYAKWMHPLSPYYLKQGEGWLPTHPRAGRFGYHSWLGVVAREAKENARTELALTLRTATERLGDCNVIVAGWAMGKATPQDFLFSTAPYFNLPEYGSIWLEGLVKAAEEASKTLSVALIFNLEAERNRKGKAGYSREAQREVFFLETETRFRSHVDSIKKGKDPRADWLSDLRNQALKQFDAMSLPLIAQSDMGKIKKLVEARKRLANAFFGHGDAGKKIFTALELEAPPEKKGKAA